MKKERHQEHKENVGLGQSEKGDNNMSNFLGLLPLSYTSNLGLFISGVVVFLFGGWSPALTVLITIQALDIITGLMVASKEKTLSSTIMREGLMKKFGIWIIVIVAHFVDIILFGGGLMVVTTVTFAFIANEGMSITENLAKIGVPIPEPVIKYLKQIKDSGEKEGEE